MGVILDLWMPLTERAVTSETARRIIVGGGDLCPGLERVAPAKHRFVVLRCSESLGDVLEYSCRLSPCVAVVKETSINDVIAPSIGQVTGFGKFSHILVSAMAPTAERIEEFIRCGCSGILNPADSPATVFKAAETVITGQLWVDHAILSHMVRTLLFADRWNLTERESQILNLIGHGYKNQNIAERLFISPQTVRWHIRSLYTKIGVRDRQAAIHYARCPSPSKGTRLAGD